MQKSLVAFFVILFAMLNLGVGMAISEEVAGPETSTTTSVARKILLDTHDANMKILRSDQPRTIIQKKLSNKQSEKANWNTAAYIFPVAAGAVAFTSPPAALALGLSSVYANYKKENGHFNVVVKECSTLLSYQTDIDTFDASWKTKLSTTSDPVPSELVASYTSAFETFQIGLKNKDTLCP